MSSTPTTLLSFRMNIFVKLLLIIMFIVVLNAESLFIAGLAFVGVLGFLLRGSIRNSWMKLAAKLAIVLVLFIILDLIFKSDIEATLMLVGRLLCYTVLLVWLKETTTIDSYLSDVFSSVFAFGNNLIARKLDSFFHYLNFYVIATISLVGKFVEVYEELLPKKTAFMTLFMQVFVTTLLQVPVVKAETNNKLAVINYRAFDWKANLFPLFIITLLAVLYWTNCEELCRSFLLK